MYRILTEPVTNLLRQHVSLLATEDVSLEFEDDAVREVARIAAEVNRTIENIGARRLHTVLERIVEEVSYEASEYDAGTKIVVDKELVVICHKRRRPKVAEFITQAILKLRVARGPLCLLCSPFLARLSFRF